MRLYYICTVVGILTVESTCKLTAILPVASCHWSFEYTHLVCQCSISSCIRAAFRCNFLHTDISKLTKFFTRIVSILWILLMMCFSLTVNLSWSPWHLKPTLLNERHYVAFHYLLGTFLYSVIANSVRFLHANKLGK